MATETYACDLSARLYTSTRIYEVPLEDRWLLFAPDRPGLPVLVDQSLHALLHAFQHGLTVGEFLSQHTPPNPNLDETITAIGFLEERGFLRSQRDPDRYGISPEHWDQPPTHFSVWLHVNNGCNLACDYCFVRSKSKDLMSPDALRLAVERIAQTARSNNVSTLTVKFAGGEPTLAIASLESAYDQLTDALRGTATVPQFVVLTNGTAISERVLSFLQRQDVGIGISLDGPKDYHDVHRYFARSQRGSWDIITRNIARLQEHGVHPHIMTTLTVESCPGLTDLAEWVFGHGLAARFNVVRPQYAASTEHERRAKDYADIVESCTQAFEQMFTKIEAADIPVEIASHLHICELSFDYPLNGPACGIGRSHIIMDHRGNLADCVMNVSGAPTKASSDLLVDVRKTIDHVPYERQAPPDGQDCFECRWFPVCGGGCPMANVAVNGHPYTRSPLCGFYQYVIPRYLQAIGKQMRDKERRMVS